MNLKNSDALHLGFFMLRKKTYMMVQMFIVMESRGDFQSQGNNKPHKHRIVKLLHGCKTDANASDHRTALLQTSPAIRSRAVITVV